MRANTLKRYNMKPLSSMLLLLLVFSGMAQEKPKFKERFYTPEFFARYYFVQGAYTWTPTGSMYGLQFKRIKCDAEEYISDMSGYTLCLNYARFSGRDYFGLNAEAHWRNWPFTLGIIRPGAGADYLGDLTHHYFSLYPSVGLDIGGVELTYAYLIRLNPVHDIPHHRLKIAVGLWVKHKKE
jgi:hypothetical protein